MKIIILTGVVVATVFSFLFFLFLDSRNHSPFLNLFRLKSYNLNNNSSTIKEQEKQSSQLGDKETAPEPPKKETPQNSLPYQRGNFQPANFHGPSSPPSVIGPSSPPPDY